MLKEQDKFISVGFYCRVGGVPDELAEYFSKECWDSEIEIVTENNPNTEVTNTEHYIYPQILLDEISRGIRITKDKLSNYQRIYTNLTESTVKAKALKNGEHKRIS